MRMTVHASAFDILQQDGFSPLHVAASEGDENLVKFLLSNKANPYIADKVNDI